MHRPRNRQPRGGTENRNQASPSSPYSSNNPQGRGRGRGPGPRPFTSRNAPPSSASVPTIDQLAANTSVSIILKQDQPTGCQVQGFVAEVLTHGNHPRGIKVRLTDGRVGRVQRLASVDEAESGTSRGEELGRNGELLEARSDHAMNQTSGGSAGKVTYHDFRTDGYHYDYERRDHGGPSLEDYIVTKAPRGRKKASRATDANAEDETSTTANTTLAGDETAEHDTSTEYASFNSALSVCPVCHAFEGDEDAVAHHVASHFD